MAIADLVRAQKLDAILLQEVCAGTKNSDKKGASQVDQIVELLGKDEWSAVSAPVMRPPKNPPPPAEPTPASSTCRGVLSGDVGVAILVKGEINWSRETALPLPPTAGTSNILCAGVAGWETHLCTTHIYNSFDRRTTAEITAADDAYAAEIAAVADQVKGFRPVILGGDFNTLQKDKLRSLFSSQAECDQRAYHTGDTVADPRASVPAIRSSSRPTTPTTRRRPPAR
ncbi:hypothetical protein OG247_06125 [Streptomyces sp. NBC_01244]|nr:hypothetical protein OG247_06125 [Streptomyces sp. NBC_01244]